MFIERHRYGKSIFSLEIHTRSMSCIIELCSFIYIKFSMYNELTPIALAYWIMGDGTFKGITLLFCTDSYSIKDIVN